MSLPLYKFRLRVDSKQGGKFAFEQPTVSTVITEALTLELAARNAKSLDMATRYHIDATGFRSEQEAREAGEALRVRLRLLNAILNLGLNIPNEDRISGHVSEEIKKQMMAENGTSAIDNIWGLNVYPDDGLHFEYVFGGDFEVRPSEPTYIFEGLKSLWTLDISLDIASETALNILGLATQETSDKAAFLASFLSLEQLVDRNPRSGAARAQIQKFQKELAEFSASNPVAMTNSELQSLTGALAALNEESFSSALRRFARSIEAPAMIKGATPERFLSVCIETRNKIAHKAELGSEIALAELTAGLREVVLGMIWNRNNLPPISMNIPPSAVRFPEEGVQIRAM